MQVLSMHKTSMAVALLASMGLGACTTGEGALVGGATGAAVGGLASNSVTGAVVGAGVGALAGAVLVESTRGTCTYRYRGRIYRERC
jgi:osmotically inducible lipoprotein OsmB